MIDNLNAGQLQFYNILTDILECKYGKSSTDGGLGFSRLVFLRGRGGTGKSTCVNAVRNMLAATEEVVMATTGKAATVIGGSTVFSKKNGLALPIGKTFNQLPAGPILRRLQDKYKYVRVIFVDECSMLHQKHLHFMDQRLQQIKCNNFIFGGIIVILIGDTGQLPAVLGRVMWEKKPKTPFHIAGLNLYREFQTVVTLKENLRLEQDDLEATFYDACLTRLRDGKCTSDDYNQI